MTTPDAGYRTLADFVAATAGRAGTVTSLPGGTLAASPFPMAHGFVTAAFRTDPDAAPAAELVDGVLEWAAAQQRAVAVWVPGAQGDLARALAAAGAALGGVGSPAMVADGPVAAGAGFRAVTVDDDATGATFGRLAEAGYALDGMAWLMDSHDSYRAPGTTWWLVHDEAHPDDGPVSVACGHLAGDRGGIYYVATPPAYRGRGAAAAVTAAATNALFAAGATSVTLQATQAGFPVYRRLGFRTYDTYWTCELPPPSTPVASQ